MTSDKILKDRVCVVCGRKFDVELKEGNVIPEQYFYSKNLGSIEKEEGGEYWECEFCSGYMIEKIKDWIEHYWGTRCPDYEEECPLCKAWKCFDYLFGDMKEDE